MTEQEIKQFEKGALVDKPDKKDYIYEDVVGVGEPVDWSIPFTVDNILTKPLKVEHQGSSDSCVGQAFAYYAEVLEDLENKNYTDLSARDIFSRIAKSYGAYLRDGAKCLARHGVCKEELALSYENGKPPSKTFMRKVPTGVDENASQFKSKSYATLYSSNNIDKLAEIIRDNNGCVSGLYGDNKGWKTAYPKPPVKKDWAHALYFNAYRKVGGKKQIGFTNSWGIGWGTCGRGWLEEDYFNKGLLFSAWTLVDIISNKKTMKLVIDGNNQYIIDEECKFAWSIPDENMLGEIVNHFVKVGQPLGEPEKKDLTDYFIVSGTTASNWKQFLNLNN